MKNILKYITVVFLLPFSFSFAQTLTQGYAGTDNRAAQYFLGAEDQVLMAVNVWGFVNKPGQYMVPLDTDLVSLLSYAGGPNEDAKIKGIKLIRVGQDTSLVFDIDVKRFINHGDLAQNPLLKPGDTIVVSGTSFYLFSKIFELGWRIATIVQAIYFAQWYATRK